MPPAVEWLLSTGVVLTSVLDRSPDAPPIGKFRVERVTTRPYIPYGTVSWRVSGQSRWQPLSVLPAAWGLRPLRAADVPVVHEDDEGDADHARRMAHCSWPRSAQRAPQRPRKKRPYR